MVLCEDGNLYVGNDSVTLSSSQNLSNSMSRPTCHHLHLLCAFLYIEKGLIDKTRSTAKYGSVLHILQYDFLKSSVQLPFVLLY